MNIYRLTFLINFIQLAVILQLVSGSDVLESVEVVGTDCKLIEPIYNTTFDLNPLQSELAHKISGNHNDFIEFNVCGPLLKKCNGKSHVSACLTKNGQEVIIGVDSKLMLSNGKIHFNQTGEKCENNNEYYRLQILLICDYSSVPNPIVFMPYNDDQCVFYVLWSTPHACLPLPTSVISNSCSVKDEKTGHVFNLMPFSQSYTKLGDRNGNDILINICKPVQYGQDSMCPPGSSICLSNRTETNLYKKFKNYGTTVADPTFFDRQLTMRFSSDEKCNATLNYSSSISFICDKSVQGEPEFVSLNGCDFQFVWPTELACDYSQPCKLTDPITGFTYDLMSLSQQQYNVKQDNHSYTFGVCSAAKNPCIENAGICQTDNGQTASLGTYNTNLMFNATGSPYLIYNQGGVCDHLNSNWRTKIEFVCATVGMAEGPIIIENTNCEIIIHFVTKLACQEQISCTVHNTTDHTEIDLSPLISTTDNYLAVISDKLIKTEGPPILYYINVCRPLVPKYGLSCPASSAACRAINGTKTPEKEQSLGYPDVSLTLVDTMDGSRAQLRYLRGGICPDDEDTELSAVIDFYCDVNAGQGHPVLQEIYHNCQYVFDWPTNVICPKHSCQLNRDTCEVHNDQLKTTLDLKKLSDKDGNMKIEYKTGSFSINVCQSNLTVTTDYGQSTVKAFFTASGNCGTNGLINVELRLVCSATESNTSSSEIVNCGLILIKETPLVCPLVGIVLETHENMKPSITDDSVDNDSLPANGISTLGAILITITVVSFIVCIIYIVLRTPGRREKIRSLFRRRSVAVQYTRVRTIEEASLLMPQPGSLSESDDELLI